MRTKKRAFVVIMALIALVLPVVVACGGSKDVPPESTTAGERAESLPAALQEVEREPCLLASSGPLAGVDPRGQTVIWWHAYDDARAADLHALIGDFNFTNGCGITVIAEKHGPNLREKLRAAFATGETPGLVAGDQTDRLFYVLAGGLTDLRAYIDDASWGLAAESKRDFVGTLLEAQSAPQFGFPLTRTVEVLFYNQTWLEKLGFSGPPTGTVPFKEMACAAAQVKDAEGFVFNDAVSVLAAWAEATTGSAILNHDRTGYSFNHKAVIDTTAALQDLYAEGCVDFRPAGLLPAQFAARGALFAQGSSAGIPAYKAAMDATGSDAKDADMWGVLPLPRDDGKTAPALHGGDLMIPTTNPETQLAAWLFLKWIAAPAQQARWIRPAEEFPARASVVALLDVEAWMPQWGQAFALLAAGVPEPPLVSYPAVRAAAAEAFDRIMQGDDVRRTLSRLHFTANTLQQQALAEGAVAPIPGPCPSALSGPLAGIDPRGQTVVWWHSYGGALEAEVQAMIGAFNASNPCGIAVIGESLGVTLDDRMATAVADGALPALAVGNPNAQAAYALSHALVDMNAYMADSLWGLPPEARADFFAPFLAQGVHPAYAGQRLGFPLARSMQILFYNQTWLETLRYSGPFTSTTGFKTATCAAAKARGAAASGASGYLFRTDATAMASWIAAFGGVSQAGDVALHADGDRYAYNTPAAVAAMTYLNDLYGEGCITSTVTGAPGTHFAARRAPFVLGSTTDIPRLQRAMEAAENEDVWEVTTLPYSATVPAPIVYGDDFVIPTTNPETQLAAWIFIRWFTAPEQQTRWVYAGGDLPTRASVAAQMQAGPFAPQWFQALALLPYGVYEPQLVSYPSVSDAIPQAFERLLREDDLEVVLNVLTRQANQLQNRAQTSPRP
jgi:multiple sugar transport system substrate-binding protein